MNQIENVVHSHSLTGSRSSELISFSRAIVKVRDGDVVLVRDGYHPVVAGPGYDVYYLNFLAGLRERSPSRKILTTPGSVRLGSIMIQGFRIQGFR
jgi:hypothetical protein